MEENIKAHFWSKANLIMNLIISGLNSLLAIDNSKERRVKLFLRNNCKFDEHYNITKRSNWILFMKKRLIEYESLTLKIVANKAAIIIHRPST